MSKLYKKSGVDVIKTDKLISQALKFIKSSHSDNVLGNKLGFSAEYKVNKDITLCAATDGVGTKAILAAELNEYKGIGQDLVAMCSNDLLCNKAKPLFFLDYFACSSVKSKQYTEILKSITSACKKINCALIGGETAEMPTIYQPGHCDFVGNIVGIVDKTEIIHGPSFIQDHDVIFGFPSSGPHTNGYSLLRKLIQEHPEQFSDTFRKELCTPHQSYLSLVKQFKQSELPINGLCHITGGGFTENIERVIPDDYSIQYNQFEFSTMFQKIQSIGGFSRETMMSIFNCGWGLLLIGPSSNQSLLDTMDITYTLIGNVYQKLEVTYR